MLEKIEFYISVNTIRYIIKHPKRFLYYFLQLHDSPNYILFTSKLLNLEVKIIKKNLPSKLVRKNLRCAFENSIFPKSEEMPLSFEEAMSCYLVVRLMKPKVVIETGVSAGRSSAFILQALEDNNHGYLYSIDPNPNSGYAIPNSLRKRWVFVSKKSSEILPSLLKELGEIGMFLHDSLHTYENMMYEFETVYPFITKGGIILSDDINFNKAFQDFCKKHSLHPVFLNNNFAGVKKD
jgi:hypothetical protein